MQMADFPGPSETISKVLLSILPPKAYSCLTAFLPGLFFEVSVFLANPQLIEQLKDRADQAAQLGKYPEICIAIFLAFVIGHGLLLWVGFVHRVIGLFHRLGRSFGRRFCIWPLLPMLNYARSRRQGSVRATIILWNWLGRLGHSQWMNRVFNHVQTAVNVDVDFDSEGVRKLWAKLARQLFGKQYGIDAIDRLEQKEWNALYEAARSNPVISLGDHMFMIASQALGWGGLAATRFAPQLATRTYFAFSLFFVAIGIMYEWWLIRTANNQTVQGLLRVGALLSELRKNQSKTAPNPPKIQPDIH
jgi:hypothetical protein